jgi:hypothetical protein
MSEAFDAVDGQYASLAEFVSAFTNSPDEWLFRGEASVYYPATTSMLQRVREDPRLRLPPKARKDIEALAEPLATDLRNFLSMSQEEAWAFLQHYEFPTDRFDFTAVPSISAYFATGAGRPVPKGTKVLLAALKVSTARGKAEVRDLRNHPKAERPRRQHAFTLFVPDFPGIDLKSSAAREDLGVQWFECTVTRADLAQFGGQGAILDARTDLVAGVISLLIDDNGKINDWSAKWLADRVAAAPFVTRLVRQTATGEGVVDLCSSEEAGLEYEEVIERFNNHRYWSNQYRERRGWSRPVKWCTKGHCADPWFGSRDLGQLHLLFLGIG